MNKIMGAACLLMLGWLLYQGHPQRLYHMFESGQIAAEVEANNFHRRLSLAEKMEPLP